MSATPTPWTDGNEAIHINIDRSRPWAGTVFRKGHDGTEADALVAMCFAPSSDEAAELARQIAAAQNAYQPMLEALEDARSGLQAMLDRWLDFHDAHSLTDAVTGGATNAFDKALEARDQCDAAIALAKGETA